MRQMTSPRTKPYRGGCKTGMTTEYWQHQLLRSQIQRLRSNKVTNNLTHSLGKLSSQIFAAHNLGSLHHLSQDFLETTEKTNQAAFVNIGHFARACKVRNK